MLRLKTADPTQLQAGFWDWLRGFVYLHSDVLLKPRGFRWFSKGLLKLRDSCSFIIFSLSGFYHVFKFGIFPLEPSAGYMHTCKKKHLPCFDFFSPDRSNPSAPCCTAAKHRHPAGAPFGRCIWRLFLSNSLWPLVYQLLPPAFHTTSDLQANLPSVDLSEAELVPPSGISKAAVFNFCVNEAVNPGAQ